VGVGHGRGVQRSVWREAEYGGGGDHERQCRERVRRAVVRGGKELNGDDEKHDRERELEREPLWRGLRNE
jgi:hypothetical protein